MLCLNIVPTFFHDQNTEDHVKSLATKSKIYVY